MRLLLLLNLTLLPGLIGSGFLYRVLKDVPDFRYRVILALF